MAAEMPERVAAIKQRTGKLVMKVIKVAAAGDVEQGIKPTRLSPIV